MSMKFGSGIVFFALITLLIAGIFSPADLAGREVGKQRVSEPGCYEGYSIAHQQTTIGRSDECIARGSQVSHAGKRLMCFQATLLSTNTRMGVDFQPIDSRIKGSDHCRLLWN